jgi:serine/threonine-protein kinase HipA
MIVWCCSTVKPVSSEVEVFVAVGDRSVLAGRMNSRRVEGAESASFAYDDSYLERPGAYALDPALPLVAGSRPAPPGRVLFGAFADSLPDRWGRMLVRGAEQARAAAAAAVPDSISELDLLLGVRDDLREGALRFRVGDQPPFLAAEDSVPPVLADLPALLDLAARAEQDTADYDDLRLLVRAGSSLGGARPKAHVVDAAGRVAIAKFPSVSWDTWDVMAWEKVALDLAAGAGITVPRSQLLRVAGRHVLIVERFDRRDGTRVGYASALTMLQAGYGDRRSYLDIAAVIGERSPAATEDLRRLWRRMAFSVLISNTDDHLRNHGFLHGSGDSWALSPAFDLNPNPAPGPKDLSTAIDLTDRRASVDALLSVAGRFRLDRGEALDILAQVTRAAARWADVAMSHGLARPDLDVMEPAFVHAESKRAQALTSAAT